MRTSCTACLSQTSLFLPISTLFFYIARNNLESINFEYSAILLHQSPIARANIVLTDISQGMLDEAAKRFAQIKMKHYVKLVKSDITDMKELETACFDFVFSQYDAVSYCLKPAKAVKELARIAKKSAYVIVSLDTKFGRVPELIEAGQIDEAEKLLETNISYDFDFPQYNLTWEELSDCFRNARLLVLEVIGAPVFMHQVNERILEKLEADPKIRNRLLQIELA
jgi:SAM-dependent methyltransferase